MRGALAPIRGVIKVVVFYEKDLVSVTYRPKKVKPAALVRALKKAGFKAWLTSDEK